MPTMQKLRDADSAASDDPSKDRRFVTALARGLDVLRCFEPGDVSLGNLEIARRTGLPKPTVSRLTYTLTTLGYLTYSERHGTYQLGSGVLSLGYAMLAGLDIRERARPLMQEFADDVDATIALGSRDRLSMVYTEVCRGPGAVTLRMDVGSRVPIATTSMGRAFMAALPESEREYLLAHIRKNCADAAEFRKIEKGLAEAAKAIEKRGFCLSIGEWRRDVNAAGVAFVGHDGEVFGLNCGGPAFRLSQELLENDYGPRLVKLARRIAAAD